MSIHSSADWSAAFPQGGTAAGRLFGRWLLCAALGLAPAGAGGAHEGDASDDGGRRELSVVGIGRAETAPDRAEVSAALQVRAGSGREAKTRLERLLGGLLAELAELGVPEEDIRAESLRLHPEYENVIFSGYSARRDLAVTLRGLERIGEVTDLLAQRKEARIHGVSYRSSQEAATREEALRRAMADSRARAELIAADYGMTLGKPLRVAHAPRRHGPPVAFRGAALAMESAPAAPYLADALSFEETVEVTFEIH